MPQRLGRVLRVEPGQRFEVSDNRQAWLAEIEEARGELTKLCRRGRLMARFVRLWCLDRLPGAAAQLAAAERVNWPLPDGPVSAWELMQGLVDWEDFARKQQAG